MDELTFINLFFGSVILLFFFSRLRKLLVRPYVFTFADLFILSVGFFFGLSPWVLYFYRSYIDFELSNLDYFLLIKTYLAVLLFLSGLLISNSLMWGRREKNHLSKFNIFTALSLGLQNISFKLIIILLIYIWLIRIFIGVKYGIFFSGTATSENVLGLPYTFVILSSINHFLALGCLLWFAGIIWRPCSVSKKVLLLSFLSFELVWAIMQGRRWILEFIVFMAIGLFVLNPGLAKKRLRYKRNKMLIIVLVVIAVGFIFPFFFATREIYFSQLRTGNAVYDLYLTYKDMIDLGQEAFDFSNLKRNLANRVFFLHLFIYDILDAQERSSDYMMGRALSHTILWAIPKFFLAHKYQMLQTEQLIQWYYGLPLTDTAISWPAVFCSDFGLFALMPLGFIFGCVLFLIEKCILLLFNRRLFLQFVLTGGLISNLWHVEQDPVYFWSFLRLMFFLTAIEFLYRLFIRGTNKRNAFPRFISR